MLTLPETVERPERAYAYITFVVRMNQMQKPADEGFPALFAHLAQNGIEPDGAPFYNYRRIDMAGTLDVEAGVPVSRAGSDSGNIRFGTLPAGRYLTVTWHGHPDKLYDVTSLLIGWTKERNQPLDVVEKPDGDHFACRLEIYESDPGDEPDMDSWVTVLEFKLAD
ncbi:MAG: GyrI-like domain-containing protein [Candidatus Devosia phytovorans]|uniref:GyrI-like domain-containing protein n=1 Tax=Candidatus Devosia phytovorans TaxID=3121372 RepID=A0AAJ5VWA6_9HYPH|nr:GyrI-like domain-containing protein [Devosia sp.]WEK06103.1 MAG: GyrI-like domain-containing protein [Devosia sp.]